MAKPYLSIIIPAYNEEARIPKTLVDIDRRLEGAPYSYEIIVVNDGSTDGTAAAVLGMTKLVKNLDLIDNNENKGKGAAVRQGMLAAAGDIRLFTDADNSTSVDQFEKMMPYFSARGGKDFKRPDEDRASDVEENRIYGIECGPRSARKTTEWIHSVVPLKRGVHVSDLHSQSVDPRLREDDITSKPYSVVIGSRAIKGAVLDPAEPWYRQISGKAGNLVVRILLLPELRDTQCGFKAFTAAAAEAVFGASRVAGWGFDVEILALAKRSGGRIKEIPVRWTNDTRSHVKPLAYFKVLRDVFAVRWRLWTNGYIIERN